MKKIIKAAVLTLGLAAAITVTAPVAAYAGWSCTGSVGPGGGLGLVHLYLVGADPPIAGGSGRAPTVPLALSRNLAGELRMKSLILIAALVLPQATAASSPSIRPHSGPVCAPPGAVYHRPTLACGATTFHGGMFKPGRFQKIYQSTQTSCVLREIFLGCA